MVYDPSLYLGDFRTNRGSQILTTGQWVQIVPASPQRVYLALGNTSTNVYFFDVTPLSGDSTGPWMLPGRGTLEFYWDRHTLLTTLAWFCNTTAVSGNVEWLEMLYHPTELY